ncbi:MAG: hypothetical protein ICV60_22960 [Pyrinomonadaceae bacterium]|nr:hypothetical protein [Pyrinomonadaceae bacterium]
MRLQSRHPHHQPETRRGGQTRAEDHQARQLARHLPRAGLSEGKSKNDVKRALKQNAGAFITARRSFRGVDGTELTAELSDTRYGVVFTGEKFPDGRRADAVYILLHDSYRDVLNAAPTRPLDYDYLRELSPGAQRFYELLSYQIFAALRNDRPRARMLYSYYCTHAPQTRYDVYERVKKQMYKLHAPHKQSGYISAVELRETADGAGQSDWEMLYTPGRKARAEFRASSKRMARTIDVMPTTRELNQGQLELSPIREPQLRSGPAPEHEALVKKLMSFKVSEKKARELVLTKPEAVRLHILAIPYLPEGQGKKNFAGRLVTAIENDYELPQALVETLERERRERESSAREAKAKACPYCQELHVIVRT